MTMPFNPTFGEICVRLALTLLAGALIGLDRSVNGHAAGLRTTLLVALAASVAMIQANLLLPLDGKGPGSFAVMDVMRLPLGILTGVGFLGGGAILKKGGTISGVTTAATLWIVTVIGLCFGGGQLGLGAIATLLGFVTLWALKFIECRIPREHSALLTIVVSGETSSVDLALRAKNYNARLRKQVRSEAGELVSQFNVQWRQREDVEIWPELLSTVEPLGAVRVFEIVSSGDR